MSVVRIVWKIFIDEDAFGRGHEIKARFLAIILLSSTNLFLFYKDENWGDGETNVYSFNSLK